MTTVTPFGYTRTEAIARLRHALLRRCGEERTMCRAAAQEGIFCHGFRRWPEREFHDRWKGQLGVSTHLTRSQMEELADLWQLTEQVRRRDALICDAQTVCPGACRGWNEFTDSDLENFCHEILGESVHIRGKREQTAQTTKNGLFVLDSHPPVQRRLPSANRFSSPTRREERS